MTIAANRLTLHARTSTPEEVALQRLRMLGLGLLAAVVVVDAVHGPFTRWRAFGLRVIEGMDPLDRPGTGLVAIVSDLLSASDGFHLGKRRADDDVTLVQPSPIQRSRGSTRHG